MRKVVKGEGCSLEVDDNGMLRGLVARGEIIDKGFEGVVSRVVR